MVATRGTIAPLRPATRIRRPAQYPFAGEKYGEILLEVARAHQRARDCYSSRNATSGSTVAARRAGKRLAMAPTADNAIATVPKMIGSWAETP